MGTNERLQPASKSSWDSQDFGDVNMMLKMAHFHKSTGPRWVKISGSYVLFICKSTNDQAWFGQYKPKWSEMSPFSDESSVIDCIGNCQNSGVGSDKFFLRMTTFPLQRITWQKRKIVFCY